MGWVISKANAHLIIKAINALCYQKKKWSVSITKASEEMSVLSFMDFIKITLE